MYKKFRFVTSQKVSLNFSSDRDPFCKAISKLNTLKNQA